MDCAPARCARGFRHLTPPRYAHPMNIKTFAIILGVAAILGGIFLGMNRFSATSGSTTVQCTSYFSGGEDIDAHEDQMSRLVSGPLGATHLVDQCNSKREAMGIFTWVLIRCWWSFGIGRVF